MMASPTAQQEPSAGNKETALELGPARQQVVLGAVLVGSCTGPGGPGVLIAKGWSGASLYHQQ